MSNLLRAAWIGFAASGVLAAGVNAREGTLAGNGRLSAASHNQTVVFRGFLQGCFEHEPGLSACVRSNPQPDPRKGLRMHGGGSVSLTARKPLRSMRATLRTTDDRVLRTVTVEPLDDDGLRWRVRLPRRLPQAANDLTLRGKLRSPEGAIRVWRITIKRHQHR